MFALVLNLINIMLIITYGRKEVNSKQQTVSIILLLLLYFCFIMFEYICSKKWAKSNPNTILISNNVWLSKNKQQKSTSLFVNKMLCRFVILWWKIALVTPTKKRVHKITTRCTFMGQTMAPSHHNPRARCR